MKLLLVLAIAGTTSPLSLYAAQSVADDQEVYDEEGDSETDTGEESEGFPGESTEELESMDSTYSEGDFIEEESQSEVIEETMSDTPLSIQIQGGRKWYKDHSFDIDSFEFITEWYLFENLPIKVGPTLSYNNLINLNNGVAGGQILEFALRSSFFWDFGIWSPYAAFKYTIISSGSIDMKFQESNTLTRGTLDLDVSGFDLKVGTQIKVARQMYVTLEGSLLNEETIKSSGRLATTSRDEDGTAINRGYINESNSNKEKFQSISLGFLFEL
ncbi:MAG: hypothetical protein ACOH5I_09820 [Oligoflexus sp.]